MGKDAKRKTTAVAKKGPTSKSSSSTRSGRRMATTASPPSTLPAVNPPIASHIQDSVLPSHSATPPTVTQDITSLKASMQALEHKLQGLKDLAATLTTAPQAVSSASAQGSSVGPATTGPASASVALPSVCAPTFSLATAFQAESPIASAGSPSSGIIPPASCGVPSDSVSHVELISPQQRKDIILGKDINLATLLIPSYHESAQDRHLIMGNELLPLKPLSDPRTSRALTIQEFIKAFSIYTNVMCRAYPQRRAELDAYMTNIVEMSSRFAGLPFYDYHRSFSARASALLLNDNIKLDWSKLDTKLYCAIFAGQRASTCTLCNSSLHMTAFCPANVSGAASRQYHNNNQNTQNTQSRDHTSRERFFHEDKEICNLYNSGIGMCHWLNCKYAHICKACKKPGHGFSECYSVPTDTSENAKRQSGVSSTMQVGEAGKHVRPAAPKTSTK